MFHKDDYTKTIITQFKSTFKKQQNVIKQDLDYSTKQQKRSNLVIPQWWPKWPPGSSCGQRPVVCAACVPSYGCGSCSVLSAPPPWWSPRDARWACHHLNLHNMQMCSMHLDTPVILSPQHAPWHILILILPNFLFPHKFVCVHACGACMNAYVCVCSQSNQKW